MWVLRKVPILDFYPRSPCGERPVLCYQCFYAYLISIHALLAESDIVMVGLLMFNLYFYPRSPCGERQWSGSQQPRGTTNFYPRSPCGERHNTRTYRVYCPAFLSTLSLRRATAIRVKSREYAIFLSTLSLRRATGKSNKLTGLELVFLSTLSLRRATLQILQGHFLFHISIHALLAESDHTHAPNRHPYHYFYPRSPCGERPCPFCGSTNVVYISIHALLAESDREAYRQASLSHRISIHALLAESDAVTTEVVGPSRDFYPRSPCGERP